MPPQQQFQDFNFDDFLSRFQGAGSFANPSNTIGQGAIAPFLGAFGQSVGPFRDISSLGFANLADLLNQRGRVDPQALNRQLTDISASTQSQQSNLQGQLAQLGIQSSGVGQAVGGAIGQGGTELRSQAIADENQRAAERRRKDLELFSLLVQQPSLDALGLGLGTIEGDRERQQAEDNALIALVGELLGGVGNFF